MGGLLQSPLPSFSISVIFPPSPPLGLLFCFLRLLRHYTRILQRAGPSFRGGLMVDDSRHAKKGGMETRSDTVNARVC